jgi:FlaA1/EpsC-like NDP-sugar epimerase
MKTPRNRYFFFLDTVFLCLAAFVSYVLRIDSPDLSFYGIGIVLLAGLAVVIVPFVFWITGVYSRYWRYASIEELVLLGGAVVLSVIAIGAISLVIVQFLPSPSVLPRSIPFIFLLLALVATGGPRLLARLSGQYNRRRDWANLPNHRNLLVVGAGDAGANIVRELQRNSRLGMEVMGFIDDDLAKHDARIHGVPVLGSRHDIPRIVENYKISEIIIAMPTAPGKVIREFVSLCEQTGVQPKIIPGISELLNGAVTVNQLRNVQIEDLLRREPVQTDVAAVTQLIQGKRILVTGGGGSIGSELCRQILRASPTELILLGHGENSIFEASDQLFRIKSINPQTKTAIHTVIADIRFAERLQQILAQYKPNIIFHAAAHKHVPLMECNVPEAITNNVLGTRCLLDVALSTSVERFVMISTDKAVNPTSVMGASKRVAELLVHQAAKSSGKPYSTVRFGNVLGSRGSVVLTFKKQIANGGPVTVTHPDMKRYFMTIPEAAQLVLQAAVIGRGGEVFVLDMGEPIKIMDLAKDLVELSGLELGKDVDIVVTGARPGEKLFEELFVSGESYQRTQHQKIFIAANASSFVPANLNETIEQLLVAAQHNDEAAIISNLKTLIPEFQPA